jgi:hypothetical protein
MAGISFLVLWRTWAEVLWVVLAGGLLGYVATGL